MTAATPDFPDFATPVGVVDRATQLTTNPLGDTFTPGAAAVAYDVSRYGSVHLGVNAATTGTAGSKYLLLAQWREAGFEVGRQTLSFHSGPSYAGQSTTGWDWELPCYGSELDLSLISEAAVSLRIGVYGSTRQIPDQRLAPVGRNIGKLITSISDPATASSTIGPYYLSPVERAIAVASSYAISSGSLNLNGVYDNNGTMGLVRRHLAAFAGSTALMIPELLAPLTGLELTIQNNDTATHSGSVQVWDVS